MNGTNLSNEFHVPLTLVIILQLILLDRQNEKFAQKFPLINPVFRAILTPERKKRSQRALIETKQIKGENINFDSKTIRKGISYYVQ